MDWLWPFSPFLYFVPVNLWITAVFSGVRIGIMDLVLMRIRKVPPAVVVNAMITSTKAGLSVSANEIETHYLAGGHVNNVIRALISAEKANIPLISKPPRRLIWQVGMCLRLCKCRSTPRLSIRLR